MRVREIQPSSGDIATFLTESNKIEGIYDDQSFEDSGEAYFYIMGKKTLTVKDVLKTHKMLMKHQDHEERDKGHFRRCAVYIGRHEGKPWPLVPEMVQEWVDRVNMVMDIPYDKEDHETMSRSLHVQYEDIHPFIDGNGRTGRLFMNWYRLKTGLPLMIIYNDKKQEYYNWFNK